MNIQNIDKAINVMQRVVVLNRQFSMTVFQEVVDVGGVVTTEKDLHTCGSPACFSGWLAVSPEWKEFGGTVSENGAAVVRNFTPVDSLAEFLGISPNLASEIIFPDAYTTDNIYDKDPDYIEAQDVIDLLNKIKNKEVQ